MDTNGSSPASEDKEREMSTDLRANLSLGILKLEEIDRDLYRGSHLWKPRGGRGVFGGQVVGQALVAAGHTKPDSVEVHSIHCYFVRAGQPDRPILYHVDRVRDGQSFTTRGVKAVQNGEAILTMQVSYHKLEPSELEHQFSMPVVPQPEQVKTVSELLREFLQRPEFSDQHRMLVARLQYVEEVPIELKPIDPSIYFRATSNSSARLCFWVRAKGHIGEDQNLHRCVAAYLSDLTLMRTVMSVKKNFKPTMVASLDHAMWFHSSFRTDEWMLYECTTPRAVGNRGLAFGRLWKQDGTLAVSVAQEGVVRGKMTSRL